MAAKFVLLSVTMFLIVHTQGYRLRQVLILSRHNIRTPTTNNLHHASGNEFRSAEKRGHLTEKGALMEGYMGEYFHKWFLQQHLLPEECPEEKSIHIYANTKQRTIETAKAFVKSAFKDCNIKVFSIDSEEMDPIFNPVPRNTTSQLKTAIVNEMQEKLKGLQLNDAYLELNKILNIKEATICKVGKICDISKEKDYVEVQDGKEPKLMGALNIGNAVVDAFLMNFYEGWPLERVAWGQITTDEQWRLLTRITKENQNVRFNSTVLAKEVAQPLLKYILGIFERNDAPKFTLLVGHDSNLNSVMAALDFVRNELPGQHEMTPVGGKLVFQKIEDDDGKNYLKVDYVYQSFEQLRNGSKLSLENPPLSVPMKIRNCSDENGYCPWDSFIALMRNVV